MCASRDQLQIKSQIIRIAEIVTEMMECVPDSHITPQGVTNNVSSSHSHPCVALHTILLRNIHDMVIMMLLIIIISL